MNNFKISLVFLACLSLLGCASIIPLKGTSFKTQFVPDSESKVMLSGSDVGGAFMQFSRIYVYKVDDQLVSSGFANWNVPLNISDGQKRILLGWQHGTYGRVEVFADLKSGNHYIAKANYIGDAKVEIWIENIETGKVVVRYGESEGCAAPLNSFCGFPN